MYLENKPSMASSKAEENVFSIPELFSAILIDLPILDLLLRAPLVSHSWNNRIATSSSLQARLFFRPRQRGTVEVNPVLQVAFPPWFHNRPAEYHCLALFRSLDWNQSYAKRDAYSRKEASWRRMLPVQPPAKTLEVVRLTGEEPDAQVEQRGELMFEDGVRMGTLYDLGYQTVVEPVSLFWISWPMFPDMECQDYGWVCCDEDQGEDEDDVFGYDVAIKEEKITFTVSWEEENVKTRRVLGPEFRSKGYEEVSIDLAKAKRLPWDRRFGRPWNYDPNKYGI
jgi:hypothetical protein